MNRIVLAIVLGVVGLVASEAEACNRCGLFGRACRFQSHHQQAVAVAVPVVAAAPEVLVVNNVYPPANGGAALLAQQGGTVYGLQAAALQYRVDPGEVLRRADELARGAQRLAETGLAGYQTSASLALQLQASTDDTLHRGVAASAILTAAGLNPQSQQLTAPQSLRLSKGADGRWQVEQLSQGQVAAQLELRADAKQATQRQSSVSLIDQHCAKCHGKDKAAPDGGLYVFPGQSIPRESLLEAIRLVDAGKMPKGQELPNDTRAGIIRELLTLEQGE